ncbi:MAG: hypothetical protein KKG60_00055 [Nanoarchaeota archaeon]|nr:hypothetical protein [Nanoarchaeota archaeon]
MKETKICPTCGSTDITIPPTGMDLKMSFPDYCKDCKNRGFFPIINISKINQFRKRLKTPKPIKNPT